MANRSYLYSADAVPTETRLPAPVHCISEHNGRIPLAHHLLAGRDPAAVPSMIWNAPVAICADFAGGFELSTAFLEVLGRGEIPERDAFDECVEKTNAHLEKQRATHFVLEPGEIISLIGDDPLEKVRELVTGDIPESVSLAEAAIAGEDGEWLSSVRASWRDEFDSFYSDWLFHSFPAANP